MPDYSFLSNPSAQPQPLNLLGMAGQAMTLGSMAQQQQLQGLQLQTQQQMSQALPEFYQRLAQQQQPGPNGQPSQGDVTSVLSDLAQKYPLAGMQLTNMVQGMQEKQSQIAMNTQKAALDQASAFSKKLEPLGNAAAAVARDGTDNDNWQRLLRQVDYMGMNSYLQPPSVMADPVTRSQFANYVASSVIDPDKQAQMIATNTKLPYDVAASVAATNLSNQNYLLAPKKLAVEQSQAASAAQQAATHAADVFGPKIVPPPSGGPPLVENRFAPGGPTVGTVSGAPNQQGQPQPVPAGAYTQTPQAKQQTEQTAKIVGVMQGKIPGAIMGLKTLNNLVADDMSGNVYSGGVQGSDFFKNIANVMASMPGASDDMIKKVSTTQAWDTQAGDLAFEMLSSMPGTIRGGNQILKQIQNIKPNTPMQQPARMMVYNYLRTQFETQLQMARDAATQTAQPGVTNLSGLKAPAQPRVTTNPDGSLSLDLTGQ